MIHVPPPPRPPRFEERLGDAGLLLFAPRVRHIEQADPPASLAPWTRVLAPRAEGGHVDCTWFPTPGARGVVLLAPPWLDWGQSYFHRRGRIEALREAGYACLSFDMGGFGRTTPTRGFRDRDAEAALAMIRQLAPGVPVHVWGVSSGGHWLHPVLARGARVHGAMFEDVTPHLLEWSELVTPRLRAAYRAARRLFPRTDRYMDMRNHAPHLDARAVTYVAGSRDVGVPVAHTRELARLAGAECVIVDGADHLQAIKVAPREVIEVALATFERAEKSAP